MSFILDALRKSEKERKKNQVPDITTVQDNATGGDRKRFSRLIPILGGLLVISSIVIIVLLSRSDRETVTTGLPASADHMSTPTAVSIPAATPQNGRGANVYSAEIGGELKGASLSVQASQPSEPVPNTSDREEKVGGVPPLTVQGEPKTNGGPSPSKEVLPELNITTHIYADYSPSRMIGINGKIFREGQNVTDDLLIDTITPDGVVVIFRGQRYSRKIF